MFQQLRYVPKREECVTFEVVPFAHYGYRDELLWWHPTRGTVILRACLTSKDAHRAYPVASDTATPAEWAEVKRLGLTPVA